VLLHGFTGSGNNWQTLAAQLASTHTIILPDIIGHGLSDAPDAVERYDIEQAADDIAALVDGRFVLAGYSMGGRLALTIATRYPERVQALILESATPGLRSAADRAARQQSDEALADQILANGLEWFSEYWGKLPLWAYQSTAAREALRASRLQNRPIGLANSLRGMGTGAMPPLWDQLPQLTMPVLLLAGELDQKFAAINQEMASMLPDATFTMVTNAGHAIHVEQPHIWLQEVTTFLKRCAE
jgi:2-succinyl-6-hydroxy-2,4-cyclohexadiene-1-carboxylate synthase